MAVVGLSKAIEAEFPSTGLIASWQDRPDFADAYSLELPARAEPDPVALARVFFLSFPGWMKGLLWLRNLPAGLLGLKTGQGIDYMAEIKAFDASPGSRMGLFELRGRAKNELMFGQEDSHLDFRLSLIISAALQHTGGRYNILAATSVTFNNRLGNYYMALVKPFHRLIMKATLNNLAAALADRGREAS